MSEYLRLVEEGSPYEELLRDTLKRLPGLRLQEVLKSLERPDVSPQEWPAAVNFLRLLSMGEFPFLLLFREQEGKWETGLFPDPELLTIHHSGGRQVNKAMEVAGKVNTWQPHTASQLIGSVRQMMGRVEPVAGGRLSVFEARPEFVSRTVAAGLDTVNILSMDTLSLGYLYRDKVREIGEGRLSDR